MLVTEHPGETTGALGIVSLEDVIEELIGMYRIVPGENTVLKTI